MKTPSNTYRFIAVFMAFWVLLSSVGITFHAHVCQGNTKSLGFFGKAKNCYELAGHISTSSCSKQVSEKRPSNTCKLTKKACCQDKVFRIQADVEQLIQDSNIESTTSLQQLIAVITTIVQSSKGIADSELKYDFYKPPLIPKDIPVLLQFFLL